MNDIFEPGDLIVEITPDKEKKIIYQIIGIREDGYINIIVVYPSSLVAGLAAYGSYSIRVGKNEYQKLGNIHHNKLLKILYC